ncbi:MAG: sugar phosphate isomerase/epimerase [Christensenella sp.]|nr:sugar phosphate isomerase/epimerase [Christensenella sp.]
MKKISIGSWAYVFGPYASQPVPLDTVIKEVGKLGYDGISLGGFKPHAHFELYPTKEKQEALVELISSNHLEAVEYSPDVNVYSPITEQSDYLKLYEKFIIFMEQCKFPIVRLDSGIAPIIPAGLGYDECMSRLVKAFRSAAEIAADHGINVVWEFEPGFIFNKPSEVVEVTERVGHDNFSVLFDSCHAYMEAVMGSRQIGQKETLSGGVLEFIHMLSGKIGLVHLIDSDGTLHDNDTSTHRPFGEGAINFDEIIPALLGDGKYQENWWIVDLCFWPDAWNVTSDCKKFVDSLNKKYCAEE